MKWLVEEHMQNLDGSEYITFHVTVEADDVQSAFAKAENIKALEGERKHMGYFGFYFGGDELEPVDKDYRWAASDGSSVCYEVRKLDGLCMDATAARYVHRTSRSKRRRDAASSDAETALAGEARRTANALASTETRFACDPVGNERRRLRKGVDGIWKHNPDTTRALKARGVTASTRNASVQIA